MADTGKDVSLFSIGPTVMYQIQQAPTQAFLTGGIAVYNASGEGTRPGFNFGGGLGFPLTGFWATAEARMHVMLADGQAGADAAAERGGQVLNVAMR